MTKSVVKKPVESYEDLKDDYGESFFYVNEFLGCCGATIFSDFTTLWDRMEKYPPYFKRYLRAHFQSPLTFAILNEHQVKDFGEHLEAVGFRQYDIPTVRNGIGGNRLYSYVRVKR